MLRPHPEPAHFSAGSCLSSGVSECASAGSDVACSRSVVNEGMSVFGLQEDRNIGYADLHFERSRYPVEGLHALAGEILAVLMQVDEAGCDYEAGSINVSAAGQSICGNPRKLSILDSTLRTASRPVSGSMTRPCWRTMSYCCAFARMLRAKNRRGRNVRIGIRRRMIAGKSKPRKKSSGGREGVVSGCYVQSPVTDTLLFDHVH